MNSCSADEPRSKDQVKRRWEKMKSDTKKKRSVYFKMIHGTGGGPAPPPEEQFFTPLEQKVGMFYNHLFIVVCFCRF